MRKICEDFMQHGKEKTFVDYFLNVEDNTLLLHTLCIIENEGSYHINLFLQLTTKQARLLDNMSKQDCLDWVLKNQAKLAENNTIKREYKKNE